MKAAAIWILSVAWSVPCFSQVPASFEKLKAMQKLPPSIEVATLEHDKLGRPDFVGGIYEGWRKGATVPNDAPPLFLAISNNDVLVTPNSSSQLYEMWHRAERPVELHVFGNGEHGFGARQDRSLTDAWMPLFEKWLKANGFISKSDNAMDAIFPQGQKGSAEYFTGNAYNYSLVPADSTFTTLVGNVYFEPGARSNWHTHPGGQILIITDGVGYYQFSTSITALQA